MRAICFISLTLAYMASGFGSTRGQEEDIRRLQASMSVNDALERLHSTLPSDVVNLVKGLHREGTARKIRKLSFLDSNSSDRLDDHKQKKGGGVDKARKKINKMVEEAQAKWDKEEVQCEASFNNLHASMEETSADMSLYNSQNSKAHEDQLRAEGTIHTLRTTSTKLEDERARAEAVCIEQLGNMRAEIEIMKNDSAILTKILETITCPGPASLIQCRNTTTFEHSGLRAHLAQLKSDKIKGLADGAVRLAFESDESPTPISGAHAFLQLGASSQTLKHLRGAAGNGQVPDGSDGDSCSLATNPDCGGLQDKFMEIQGEVDSDITEYTMHLQEKRGQCKEEEQNFKSQITDLDNRLENWQTALGESTVRQNQANQGENLKYQQYNELSQQFHETMQECHENVGNFKSEICALGKIRGELYKMSTLAAVFIEDCRVGQWTYDDCSKNCMESDTDAWGTQNLTRLVETPATLGANCPPLKLTQACGKVRCPVNCMQSEWTEWSACSAKCGSGIRERIRSIKREERYSGEPCGPATETEPCNTQNCDKNCVLAPWTKLQFAQCSKACGGGVKVMTRAVLSPPVGQGWCPKKNHWRRFRTMDCKTQPCAPEGATLVCDSRIDVVVLLDGSGSLRWKGWLATVAMGQTLVKAFKSSSLQAHVAVQLFSGPSTWYNWWLCTGRIWGKTPNVLTDCGIKWVTPMTKEAGHFSTDYDAAAALIAAETFPRRATFTSLALAQAEAELLYGRQDVPKVVVVITDGQPTNRIKTAEAAESLKEKARLIWVPWSRGAPRKQLQQWASEPFEQNVIDVKDRRELAMPEVVTKMISYVCPEAH